MKFCEMIDSINDMGAMSKSGDSQSIHEVAVTVRRRLKTQDRQLGSLQRRSGRVAKTKDDSSNWTYRFHLHHEDPIHLLLQGR